MEAPRSAGAEYGETTLRKASDTSTDASTSRGRHVVDLDSEEWAAERGRLLASVGSKRSEGLAGAWGPLEDTREGLVARALVSATEDELRLATVVWRKRPFDAWWSEAQGELSLPDIAADGQYSLPALALPGCTDNTWLGTPGDAPYPREQHTAVWTGTEMIVWGGYWGFYIDSGGRYDPALNTWTPTSMGLELPSGRYQHEAFWTGKEMIIWGGADDFSRNTGGRYNPLLDTWKPTSVGTNVPTDRWSCCAVWTGSEMIVWGGQDLSGYTNTGARYRPATDTWLPTSTDGAVPAGRIYSEAVWTGTEMVVWGGDLNTGARYNPLTNSWTAMAVDAALAPRQGHAMVWTGEEVIVFGGTDFAASARYSPSTDSWSLLPGGVVSRRYATAVWSGREMIVWGGATGVLPTTLYNSGGRYSPATNQWTTTSLGGVPTARYLHTAVWTGTDMIVWGGHGTGSNYFDTGGLYCACPGGSLVFLDADGDGFGHAGATRPACSGGRPVGYATNGNDCDDSDAGVHPGASEAICDGIDNDCDGAKDEAVPGGCACVLRAPVIAGWWPGDGTTNDATQHHNGTLLGGGAFAAGRVGQAFSFSGSSYLEIPDSPEYELATQLTLEAWIRPDAGAFDNYGKIISKFGTAGNWAYQLTLHPGGFLRADISGDGSAYVGGVIFSPANALQPGTWAHVAMTYDTGKLKLYIDGNLVAASTSIYTSLFVNGTTPVNVGRDPIGSQYFVGLIDEPAIYSRALSGAQIRAIYDAGASGFCKTIAVAIGDPSVPARVALLSMSPNPFVQATSIVFDLSGEAPARLEVFDLLGRKVRDLDVGPFTPGRHVAVWDGVRDDGRAAAGGLYLVRLHAGAEEATRRVLLVR